ncbi:MAG: sensor domain-containing diguanylate cyclase [Myxococcaceae bacterium]|nr:sensor domain-containing diguanylate cyclase [Myxococcaceae bacterium]
MESTDLWERVARDVWTASVDGMLLGDAHGKIALINPSCAQLFGYSVEELVGQSIEILVPSAARSAHQQRRGAYHQAPAPRIMGSTASQLVGQTKSGEQIPVEIALSPVRVEGELFTLAIVRDNRARKAMEDQLRFLSTHDSLTGLFNRGYFDAELGRLQNGRKFPVGIIMIDVNNLKSLNDGQGHAAGDALLCRVAAVLKAAVRTEDLVARLGGDEFAVVVQQANDDVMNSILARIRDGERAANTATTPTRFALGADVAQSSETLLTETLRRADVRMFEDKRSSRGQSGPA